jgi:hypothetical protein
MKTAPTSEPYFDYFRFFPVGIYSAKLALFARVPNRSCFILGPFGLISEDSESSKIITIKRLSWSTRNPITIWPEQKKPMGQAISCFLTENRMIELWVPAVSG